MNGNIDDILETLDRMGLRGENVEFIDRGGGYFEIKSIDGIPYEKTESYKKRVRRSGPNEISGAVKIGETSGGYSIYRPIQKGNNVDHSWAREIKKNLSYW